QISEEHLLFQDSADNAIILDSLSNCGTGFDTFNIQILNKLQLSDNAKISTAFITFSSSGTVTQRDVISTDDLLKIQTVKIQDISVFPLSSYKLFEIVNETIVAVDYDAYNNNTLWLTYGNSTVGCKLDVKRFVNDCA
ncbi:10152_t:CDS:2, partial [Racocetra persica]